MKTRAALFLASLWLSCASAQTPVTYKVWCTLHNGGEREYTVPGAISGSVDLPIEMPEHGPVICHIQEIETREKTAGQDAVRASFGVYLSSIQQLQATNSYVPITLLSAGFAAVYGKRIMVLDTPSCAVSIELTKD